MVLETIISPPGPLSYAVEQRLRMIDFLLFTFGTAPRAALMDYFGISASTATRDFVLYMERAPVNTVIDASTHTYIRTPSFKRLFR